MEPIEPQSLLYNYFDKVPIQWAQWLRYARHDAPTPVELLKDQERVQRLQALTQLKDQEQAWNKAIIDDKVEKNMYKEMDKLHSERAVDILNRVGLSPENTQKDIQNQRHIKQTDPWKRAQMEERQNQLETIVKSKR